MDARADSGVGPVPALAAVGGPVEDHPGRDQPPSNFDALEAVNVTEAEPEGVEAHERLVVRPGRHAGLLGSFVASWWRR